MVLFIGIFLCSLGFLHLLLKKWVLAGVFLCLGTLILCLSTLSPASVTKRTQMKEEKNLNMHNLRRAWIASLFFPKFHFFIDNKAKIS